MNATAFNHQFRVPVQHGYLPQPQDQAPVGAQPGPQIQFPPSYWQAQPWPQQEMYAPLVHARTQAEMPMPPWAQQARVQAVAQQQSPPAVDQQAFVQGIITAVVTELDKRNASKEIAPSASNDKIVVGAVKKGRSKGLNTRQAIEKLGDTKGYANALWKDYFLERAEILAPKLFPNVAGAMHPGVGSRQTIVRKESLSSPSRGPTLAHAQRTIPAINTRTSTTSSSDAHPISFKDRRLGHGYQAYQPSSPLSEPGRPASVHPRRGDPIEEFHAGTLIPPFDASSQPKPPRRSPGDDRGANRFTGEDKVFFIHFLMWLLRKGSVPEKEDIFRKLARQMPHHSADAWKRHWDDHPELPDKIYIAARKRAENETLARGLSLSSTLNDDEYEDDSTNDGLCGPTLPVHPRSSGRRIRRPRGGVRVTEDDFRRMARYKYERRDEWDQYSNQAARWKEFGQRPENLQRSVRAWCNVERDRADDFERYYQECAAADADDGAESELEYLDVDRASAPSASHGVKNSVFTAVPQKRSTGSSTASAGADLPDAKRVKQDDVKPEPIVVDSD